MEHFCHIVRMHGVDSAVAVAFPLERRIWMVRGKRVMLDADLAEIYGVTTKRLNQQVRRNDGRFPPDFAFTLTAIEAKAIFRSRLQFATLNRGQNLKYLPMVFTEHGAVMLASVLRSAAAVNASIQVVRAFVRLRELIAERDGLGRKLAELEHRVDVNSRDVRRIFDVLQELVPDSTAPKRKIGFLPHDSVR